MKTLSRYSMMLTAVIIILSGCKSMNKTTKGAAIGTAGGATAGAVIGRASGNTAMGAIIGAAVGGVTGAVIGRKMDKQAEEIKKEVPGAKVERVGEGIVVEFNNKILFGYDKSDLSNAAESNLNELKQVLAKYPDTNIEIQGHTDSDGSDTYNQTLSEKRASSVAGYLREAGVENKRITTKGFGETAPKYANTNEDGKSQNRRVEFLITANDQMKKDAGKEAGTGS
ncbi:MAG: OmpA family protein [Chitinophagaceae bacterium]|nr:MAG: OmpA family protein [Chitinophagaceae bacterium]